MTAAGRMLAAQRSWGAVGELALLRHIKTAVPVPEDPAAAAEMLTGTTKFEAGWRSMTGCWAARAEGDVRVAPQKRTLLEVEGAYAIVVVAVVLAGEPLDVPASSTAHHVGAPPSVAEKEATKGALALMLAGAAMLKLALLLMAVKARPAANDDTPAMATVDASSDAAAATVEVVIVVIVLLLSSLLLLLEEEGTITPETHCGDPDAAETLAT
jgi:hypothetical protein